MASFGPYSRNKQKEYSDLDIIVVFSDSIGNRFIDLADEIEDPIGYKMDLVAIKGIKKRILKLLIPI